MNSGRSLHSLYYAIIVIILVFATLALYDYHRLYLDNEWFPITWEKYIELIQSFFYAISSGTHFGYDNTVLQTSRRIGSLLFVGGDFLLYLLFLLISGWSSYTILRLFFTKNSSLMGALLYAINPVSLYFFNLTGFILAYTSLPLIVIFIYYIIQKRKYIHILGLSASMYFLVSYTRTMGLYITLLLIFGVYYWKQIFGFISQHKKYVSKVIFMLMLLVLPFLFALIYPYLDGQSQYFAGLSNYADNGLLWGRALYNDILATPFYQKISFSEIIDNFAGSFQDSTVFLLVSSIFILGVLILSLFVRGKSTANRSLQQLFLCLFLILTTLLIGARFMTQELFINIAYKYYPFIANNTDRLYVLLISLFIYLYVYNLDYVHSKTMKHVLIVCGVIYLGLSIYPMIDYANNSKLSLIHVDNIPLDYKQVFHSDNGHKEGALFVPGNSVYFNWSSYPLMVLNNNNYASLFSDNSRLVNAKQADVYDAMTRLSDVADGLVFNLKSIFVFKDIKNPLKGQFDFFPEKDYVGESRQSYGDLSAQTGLILVNDNSQFAHFRPSKADQYEYFLYVPKYAITTEIHEYFDNINQSIIDINDRPVLIDSGAYHRPYDLEQFITLNTASEKQIPVYVTGETYNEVSWEYDVGLEKLLMMNSGNDLISSSVSHFIIGYTGGYSLTGLVQDFSIYYKQSPINTTKIYAHLSGADLSKPFLLQLNQTYGPSWKIKLVDKSYFNEKQCYPYDPDDRSIQRQGIREYFPITKNARCKFKTKLLELEDIRLLWKTTVADSRHFEGNFVGNAWLVTPQDIPPALELESDLYVVIIYEKQIYYSYVLLISGITFAVLIILSIREYVISRKHNRKS